MINSREKVALDSKIGNITDKLSLYMVTLRGEYLSLDSSYSNNLEISIVPLQGGKEIVIPVNYCGCFQKLFLGDFNGDGKAEIMLRGRFGGADGFEIFSIYDYKNGELKEMFNQNIFMEKYEFKSRYLDNYKVGVDSIPLKKKWSIDISYKSKNYLKLTYDDKGKVTGEGIPAVSPINSAYPINDIHQGCYNLFLRQKIIDIANEQVIGVVESFVSLKDNNIIIYNAGVSTYSENMDNMTKKMIENQDI
ncbi:hypothetical protein [Clostridium sp.]|uniref:hypothetical protein n=1 Tax=Clostridium sp. TaxID=1506 RepID=UPI003217DC3A